MKQKLLVVGNGMAGMRTVEELLTLAPDAYDIEVLGGEPYGNYNRMLLSSILTGEETLDTIMINDRDWYDAHGVTLHVGVNVTRIDRDNQCVLSEDGRSFAYDTLMLATGSKAVMLPIPGADLPGVIGFRDMNDVDVMLQTAQHHKHAVVIGGGLLGLEAAYGLMQLGMEVTVVHLPNVLMERQLDSIAAGMLQKNLEARGLKFQMSAQSEYVLGTDRAQALRLTDGREIKSDLVVMSVGINPNSSLAEDANLHTERGIVVNDHLQTSDPDIYAVGECVEHRNVTYGLVAPLFEQARVCAMHMAKAGSAIFEEAVTSTKLKVTGIDLFSAGDFIGDELSEELVYSDTAQGIYKKLVIKNDVIKGIVLYGDVKDATWYFDLMCDKTDISAFRMGLLFGEKPTPSFDPMADYYPSHDAFSNPGFGGGFAPDPSMVCRCVNLRKDDIVNAISQQGLTSVDEVRLHTKAGLMCGACTGAVKEIVETTLRE